MIGGLVRLVKSFAPEPKPSSSIADLSPDGMRTKEEIDREFPDREPNPNTKVNPKEAERWITANFQKVKIAYVTYHQNVWQAILFYVGQTWIQWDQSRRWWIPSVPEDDFTPQPKINYYSPAIDAMASNFNTIPPIECVARDADGDEQYKRHGISQVANRLAKDFILRTGLKSDFQSKGDKPSEAALFFVLGGSLFTYVQARDKTPVESEDLGTISEKSVECDLLSSLDILVRPGSFSIGGLSGTGYTYVCRRMTIQEIYTRFGVNADPDNNTISGANNVYQASLNYFYTGSNSVDLAAEDSALVSEVLIPPSSDVNPGIRDFAKTGLYGVYIGDKLKYVEDYQFPDHPITKIDYIRVPRLFFARTPAFDMCGLQEEIQTYESIIKLHGMCNAVSPWVIDSNTLVGEITGRADKVIKYRSIGPNSPRPTREPPGTLDNGIYEQVQKLKAQFENISGAASVFRGRQEGSVVASSAIAQLRGQAELMFARPVLNWNNGWKETVRKAVLFMQKCYTIPQIMAIVGANQSDSINDFLNCNLDECVEWLASGHGLPRTQDEMRMEMMELFDRKALDPKDVNVKEKLFQLFGETGMMTMFNLDATRARFENKQMKRGVPPTFRPAIEDMEVHYALHTEAVKSLEFDRLPPNVQEIFLAHIMETKAAMAPPAPLPEPDSLAIKGDLSTMPAPLVDAILEKHGITPAPEVEAPPDHHIGKPLGPGQEPPQPIGPNRGTTMNRLRSKPQPASNRGNLPSQGKPSGSPVLSGQGIQPVGAAKGAPPKPVQ